MASFYARSNIATQVIWGWGGSRFSQGSTFRFREAARTTKFSFKFFVSRIRLCLRFPCILGSVCCLAWCFWGNWGQIRGRLFGPGECIGDILGSAEERLETVRGPL